MSTIHFIGGEKGGVGKSVVARLCAQYCIDRQIPFTAADADGSHGALMRFYGGYTTPIDLTSFPSADQILGFATDADRRVVVDLPAQSDRLLGAWLGESGILDLAAESGVRVVFWHVIDDGKDALVTLQRLLEPDRRQGAHLHRQEPRPRQGLRRCSTSRRFARRPSAWAPPILELPELNPAVMQKIDRLDASFWAAANGSSSGPRRSRASNASA